MASSCCPNDWVNAILLGWTVDGREGRKRGIEKGRNEKRIF
jgi:hypothetical protein